MAKRTELDELATFFIPDNFISKGTLFGGMVKTRNFVEGVVLAIAIGYPIFLLPIAIKIKCLLMVIPLGLLILGIVGVNGGPLSQFLLDFFKFKRTIHTYLFDSEVIKNKRSDKNEKA